MAVEQLPITTIGVIVIFAGFLGVLAQKLGQNPVLGYILGGFLLGPVYLHFLSPGEGLAAAFGELGLFVLLFYLGLELSLKKFLAGGSTVFLLGIADLTAMIVSGALVMTLMGYSWLFAIVVGVMLACSSTAIIAKFVIDRKMLDHPAAQSALSILIIQDFLGVILLVFITSLQAKSSALSLAGIAVVFVVAAFTVVRQLSVLVENWLSKNGYGHTETTLYALALGLVVATVANLFGLSTALGAYFAGFALAETRAGHKIKADLGFLRDFFLLFFFVSFGASLFYDPATLALAIPAGASLLSLLDLAALLVAVAIIMHYFVFGILGKKLGLSDEHASLNAILLTPLGEFVVIIAVTAAGALSKTESVLVSPLGFLLILLSVLSFGPLFDAREHHRRLMSNLPVASSAPVHSGTAPTRDSLAHIKKFALNVFVIVCLGVATLLVLDRIPNLGLNLPYGRATIALIGFLALAILPAVRAWRAAKNVYLDVLKMARFNRQAHGLVKTAARHSARKAKMPARSNLEL